MVCCPMPIYTDYTERPVVPMPRRYNSADTKRRILSACVRLFIEKGYKSTTMMEIQREADVTSSSFQNIFHTKSGVLLELVRFMFTRQFGAARSYTAENVPPVYIYARSRPPSSLRWRSRTRICARFMSRPTPIRKAASISAG